MICAVFCAAAIILGCGEEETLPPDIVDGNAIPCPSCGQAEADPAEQMEAPADEIGTPTPLPNGSDSNPAEPNASTDPTEPEQTTETETQPDPTWKLRS